MKRNHRQSLFIWSLVYSILFIFSLTGCQGKLLEEKSETPISPILVRTPSVTAIPLGSSFKLDNFRLNIPKDWYYTVVNDQEMNGWAFSSQNPTETTEKGLGNWAGGLWIISPIPQNINSDDLTANLETQIEEYGQSEFEALLLPVQQAGFLDLSNAEIVFGNASISQWAGNDCLMMDGIINVDSGGDKLSASVYLMWIDQHFISYYSFSDLFIADELAPIFQASRDSLVIP